METSVIDAGKYPKMNKYSAPLKPMTRKLIGRENLIRSIMAAFERAELCNVILLAPAGSGKALDDNEMIAVNDERGYVRMGDLQVGDEVFDEQGNPTKILGVYPQGDKQAYRVTFNNGASIVCNDEHIWTVRGKDAHKCGLGYRDMTLREMLDKGIRKRVVKRNGHVSYHTMWHVPRSHAVNRANAELPVDPYALGVLIGDGALVSQKGDALVVSSDDTYVVDKVAEALSAIAERNPANYNWYFRPMDGSDRYVRTNDVLSDDMFVDTVRGLKSIVCSIPEPYFHGSVDQRLALLHGLMDTDGCVTNGYRANVSFSTNSSTLARGIQRLAASLGFVTSVTHNDRHDDAHINREYEIHFRVANEDKHQLFTLPRHLEKLDDCLSRRHDSKCQHKFDDLGIASVVDLGCQIPMTCIYVEAESHLFQAGYDHIVTHNTALVQGTMARDTKRLYLEVDLPRMIADCQNDTNEMANNLKGLFSETERFVHTEGREVVLFIDEFHQIVQLSAAAVEALKPLLADSGTRGIRVIAATTLDEFNQYISSNQPLVERLQRINVPEPDEEATVEILKNMAKTYDVDNQFRSDRVFHTIYEYTNRYIPASSQPRKSIKVLDAMVGWYRAEGRRMDDKLLADVIQESEDVNVAFRVDATNIKKRLDEKVLAQQYATTQIERRLQLCVADLNDKTKPMSTFLFTGSTGVGKTEMAKQLAEILFNDQRRLIRFDMTEYATEESLERFRDLLTTRIWEHPYCILLLDEIEKACSPVTRLLLQVLDDGRLTNRNNREVSFTNCYIIMTTNAGSEIYKTIAQYGADDQRDAGGRADISETDRKDAEAIGHMMDAVSRTSKAAEAESIAENVAKKYDSLIKRSLSQTTGDNRFPPELIGRIDVMIPFQPLSRTTMARIVIMKLKKLQTAVRERHGVDLHVDKNVVRYLVEDNLSTDSDSGGARIVMSKLESEITTNVARFINRYPNVSRVGVNVVGNMAADNKFQLESRAYIKVSAC